MYGYSYGYAYDPLYFVVLLMGIISMIASARVNSVFQKFSQCRSMTGMTGADTAHRMLQAAGITDVEVRQIAGKLTDHYDPINKQLCLSEAVYGVSSVAAIGVAAHECGHAIQHQEKYYPMTIRSYIVPLANIGSKAGIPLILIGLLFGTNQFLINLGILVFSFAVLFQLVTLPVEFDASKRAIRLTETYGILSSAEAGDCKKVLRAAAMTYVAAAAVSIVQLLRLISLFGGRKRR